MTGERAYWLAWSRIKGVGPILQKRLYDHFGQLEIAWQASAAALLEVDGIGLMLADAIQDQRSSLQPQALLAQHSQTNLQFLTPADPVYPALLLEIADPPPVVYYRGNLELLQSIQRGYSVGIVGTRDPSDYGKRWTRRLTQHLVQQQVVIVSGLAQGIDREAHQQTLAARGQTIAVLGTGVDVIYPYAHQTLQQQIAEQGLLISEYTDGTPPDRGHFPRRNRIIAGLSRLILVTEAPLKSGALITARLANDYGREVYALPGSLDNARSQGCLELINQGAHMVLGETTLSQAIGNLPALDPVVSVLPSEPASTDVNLSPELHQVLVVVPGQPISLDRIVQQLSAPTGEILGALVQLELLGLVTQLPGMQYQRCG